MADVAISVIIPCYNAARWVGEALESAVGQGLPCELVVVDDGSSDETAAVVARDWPQARLLRTARRGPSHARNVGTRAAVGRLLQYLDADDRLAPGKWARQLEALERGGADVAYGDWQLLDPDADGRTIPGRLIQRQIAGDPELALFTDFWCPPAVYLFRREIVERIGGWPEQLPIIQDARFALNCALHGGRFVYCPGLMAYYRHHRGGSVSTQDPAGFLRDCRRNAEEIEAWWTAHGGVTAARRAALQSVYGHVAHEGVLHDRATFETACRALERLAPGYRPDRPRWLTLTARLVGYRRAERLMAGPRAAAGRLRALGRALLR